MAGVAGSEARLPRSIGPDGTPLLIFDRCASVPTPGDRDLVSPCPAGTKSIFVARFGTNTIRGRSVQPGGWEMPGGRCIRHNPRSPNRATGHTIRSAVESDQSCPVTQGKTVPGRIATTRPRVAPGAQPRRCSRRGAEVAEKTFIAVRFAASAAGIRSGRVTDLRMSALLLNLMCLLAASPMVLFSVWVVTSRRNCVGARVHRGAFRKGWPPDCPSDRSPPIRLMAQG